MYGNQIGRRSYRVEILQGEEDTCRWFREEFTKVRSSLSQVADLLMEMIAQKGFTFICVLSIDYILIEHHVLSKQDGSRGKKV